MDLQTYFKERGRCPALARALGMNAHYLWQVANNWDGRKASRELAQRIEAATDGVVLARNIRPDLDWPEAA